MPPPAPKELSVKMLPPNQSQGPHETSVWGVRRNDEEKVFITKQLSLCFGGASVQVGATVVNTIGNHINLNNSTTR